LSEFIFMLTHGDETVADALEVYESVRELPLAYVGFKDVGLPLSELRELVDAVHADGRSVMLEVVSERREDELRSAEAALELGVDYLLGGTNAREVGDLIGRAEVAYFPFPGPVVGHPSVLGGTIEEVVAHTVELASFHHVAGLDLLAYRFVGDAERLIERVVASVDVPVIVAGSIDSDVRIERVAELGAWGFTVGSAIFNKEFAPGGSLPDQIRAVLSVAEKAAL
jgi:hypothetical protein